MRFPRGTPSPGDHRTLGNGGKHGRLVSSCFLLLEREKRKAGFQDKERINLPFFGDISGRLLVRTVSPHLGLGARESIQKAALPLPAVR